MSDVELKSWQFRREREPSWRRLADIVARAEKRSGMTSLTAEELADLPRLYRQAVSSLSLARSISLDRNLVDWLEALTARAYFCVYGTKRSLAEVVVEFLGRGFPAAVYRFRYHLLVSWLLMLAGCATGWILTARDPDWFYSFVDPAMAQDRDPLATTAELRATLFNGSASGAFAAMLFTHNAQIGLVSFALGFAFGLPVFYLLFQNGLVLGAFAALFASRGLSFEFWGWVLPHGVTELLALALCGAAGLALGQAVVLPGRHTRRESLLRVGREAGRVATGAVLLFVIAGGMEGIFRGAVTDTVVRWCCALVFATFWVIYFATRRHEVSG